jgi:hypothetical protein
MSKKTLGLSLLGLVAVFALVIGSGFVSLTKITIQNTWTVDCGQPDVYACTGQIGATNNDNLYLINPMINGSYHQRLFESLHNGETHKCLAFKDLSQSKVYYIMWCR